MTKRFSTEKYIAICTEVHNGFYKYPNTVYSRQKDYVEVECPLHGPFKQIADCHRTGKGCEKCAAESRPKVKRENAAKKFVAKALFVTEHIGRNYTYNNAIYLGAQIKLRVTCPIHDDFEVTPNNHLRGRGCPDCGGYGYRRNKPGRLYILNCNDVTKVGITNNLVNDRKNSISNSYGDNFTVLREYYFDDGSIPCKVETELLQYLKERHFQPTDKFQGSTEAFYEVDLQELLEVTQQLIQEHLDAQTKQ